MNSTSLSVRERTELARLEGVIRSGLQSFIDVGNALLDIRDRRLYRADHRTFEEYCRERWRFSKSHANRLILGAQAAVQVGEIEVAPINEAQARPLTALPPAQQSAAWQAAVKATGGRPTAAAVREAVREVLQRPVREPATPRDVRFVHRVRLLHGFATWAESEGISAKLIEKILGWLRANV